LEALEEWFLIDQLGKYRLDHIKGPKSENIRDQAKDAPDQAVARTKDAADKVQGYAEQIGDRAVECGEKAQELVLQYKSFVKKSLREKPMTTLAGAAVIGFILGALWKK
jgi:ElaB/YqjD/DUF883 family membrane-anchored ribosome-binding protein